MALTLKTTGLAAEAIMVLAVDDDGSIKEFVSPAVDAAKTLGTGVATADGSWKGQARKYWSTGTHPSPFDFSGVKFTDGNRPNLAHGNAAGFTVIDIFHSIGAAQSSGGFVSWSPTGDAGNRGTRRSQTAPNGLTFFAFSSERGASTVTIPNDGTKYFTALTFQNTAGVGTDYFQAAEGDADITATGTSTSMVGFASSGDVWVYGVGGFNGQGNQTASRYLTAIISRKLSQAEVETIFDDWFNVFFDGPAGVVHDVSQSGAMAATATMTLVQTGFGFKRRFWRVPSNAPNGTAARMVVFNNGSPANAVSQEGSVTADASGNFDLPTSDTSPANSRRMAVLHDWNGLTGTTLIRGGPGIATLNEVDL